ncbi:MAG TPA: TIGR03087 family PEP-CTERM/XrtA system glycosyltransferase [Terriglobales bacterium]|nr:TIGR03087 family PEP-CTERM/XrtA system glycosyltransferase [Terriglobales bacterium]
MRILFLAHRLPYPPNKGDKIRSCWELRSLAEHHQLDLACFYDQAEDEKYIDHVARYCDHCYVEQLSVFGSRLRAGAALLRGQPFSIAYFHSAKMARAIRGAVSSRNYDLIFVFSSSMAHYVSEVRGIPKVLDMVDVDSEKWQQYSRLGPGPLSWLWRYEARHLGRYETRLVTQYSATLVCTHAEAELLRRRTSDPRINVVGNVLDIDYFDSAVSALPEEISRLQPYVVFSGAMDYRPNADAVIYFCREILPLVRQRMPNIGFVIAGMNPSRSVRQLESDKGVKVTGTVEDIRPYLRGAAAAVIPMRLSRGIQNKVLESMAMGLPVITTTRVAATLPASVSEFLLTEDQPETFAARVAAVVTAGFKPPRDQLRRVLAIEYGAPCVFERLQDVLARAVNKGVAEPRVNEVVVP